MRALVIAALLTAASNVAFAAGSHTSDPLQALPGTIEGGLRELRAQVMSQSATTIGAPMAGRLVAFPLRDGDRFNRNDVIARFDCNERDAATKHAAAALEAKQHVLHAKAQLRALGTGSGIELEVASAEVHEAQADLVLARSMVQECTVVAPFSGRVGGVSAHNWEFLAVGAPMIDLLDDRNLEAQLVVPSQWLIWLKPGQAFGLAIDETGETYRSVVSRISGKVDAVSRSIAVYARIEDPNNRLLPGMSGRAMLSPPEHAQR